MPQTNVEAYKFLIYNPKAILRKRKDMERWEYNFLIYSVLASDATKSNWYKFGSRNIKLRPHMKFGFGLLLTKAKLLQHSILSPSVDEVSKPLQPPHMQPEDLPWTPICLLWYDPTKYQFLVSQPQSTIILALSTWNDIAVSWNDIAVSRKRILKLRLLNRRIILRCH